MNKAIALISGGLDSLLAAKLVQDQGIEVIGVVFVMPFASRDIGKYKKDVQTAADDANIPIKFVDISEEFLKIVKGPKYGYGANINPCIDCKILMLRTAKKIMEKENAKFIVTGEVLGERPMSQNKKSLLKIKKESGLEECLLRPLSAKLLEETAPEKEGIVDREKLKDIEGRSRSRQFELAQKYGITKYFSPAGGCLLTDGIFTKKLKDLIATNGLKFDNIDLLKYGRHFRLDAETKAVIGRNESENNYLKELKKPDDLLLRLKGKAGPYGLMRGAASGGNIAKAAALVLSHSKFKHEKEGTVEFWQAGHEKKTVTVSPLRKDEINSLRIY